MIDESYSIDRLAIGSLGFGLAAIALDALVGPLPLVRPLWTVLLVALVPGGLALHVIGVGPQFRAKWFVYAVGVSLLLFMLVGLALNLVLPVLDVAEPLSMVPLILGMTALIGLLVVLSRRRGAFFEEERTLTVRIDDVGPAAIGLLLLPPLGIIGVSILNATGSNLLVLAVLAVVALVPFGVALKAVKDRYLPVGLYAISLTIVYHKTIWSAYVFGGHAATVAIWKSGRWYPEAETVLPNAVFSPSAARLAGVNILTQLKVINPAIVALIPVILYLSFRHYTTARRAFMGGCLFAFAHPFYLQYPPAGRAAMPVFYLALLGAIIGDPDLPSLARKLLGLAFALGIIVSHYGTSYYVMFAIVGTLVLLKAFALGDDRNLLRPDRETSPAGGVSRFAGKGLTITGTYGLFYVVSVFAWYLYTGGGRRFVAFVDNVLTAYLSLAAGGSTGSTAVRLTTNYNAPSISFMKLVYITFGVLMVIGLLAAYHRRFANSRELVVDDQFLTLATMLLALFGTTFVVAGQWGGGRPMMIVFSLTGIFAVFGASLVWSALQDTGSPDGGWAAAVSELHQPALVGFAALLAAFFLLSSGVLAATVLGGFAPSNVPVQPQFGDNPRPEIQSLQFVDADIRTHVWLTDHRDASFQIYGDRIARGQATDKYVGEITARSSRPPYRFKKKNHLSALNQPGIEGGYLLLMGHTLGHDTVSVSFVKWRPLSAYDIERPARQKVYANDHGAIYFHGNRTVGG